ncbi:MAG TPA: MlaD family protein [Solirubrobacteraceae bacterium]|nr:MlaD family protein [Solirubrobacteraceae bacterium]
MVRTIRKNAKPFAAIVALIVIALAVAVYILQEQRLRIPFIDPEPFRVNVELSDAGSVTPGQGQTAQISGVQIGDIAEVELVDGRAIVGMDIKPEFRDMVTEGSRAMLRPRTGLEDMFIQIFPGQGAPVREGATIPVRNTSIDVELYEILGTLDARTRQYVELLVHGTGRGLDRRGNDVAEVLKRFEPTVEDLARVNRAVSREEDALSSVGTSLAKLNGRLADRPRDLSQLVESGADALGGFATEEQELRRTVSELAPTLEVAQSTLRDLRPLAGQLRPTLDALVPTVRALDEANEIVRPVARGIVPEVRDEIRPFVRESRPLVDDLGPAAGGLAEAFPELARAGGEFNAFLNMLGFNPDGREGPDDRGREEGFLFWLAWSAHQGVNLHNIDDANGVLRPIFLTGTCDTIANLVEGEPALEFAMGLSPVLEQACSDGLTDPEALVESALTTTGLSPDGRPAQRREDLAIEDTVEEITARLKPGATGAASPGASPGEDGP